MQINPYTGRSITLMILILSPYPFIKNVIFPHEFMCEFAHKYVKEFFMNLCMNLSTKFIRIHMNLFEFLHKTLVMLRMACSLSLYR